MDSDSAMEPLAGAESAAGTAAGTAVEAAAKGFAEAADGTAPVTVVAHRGDPYRVRENTLRGEGTGESRGGGAREGGRRRTKRGGGRKQHTT
ncbi:hypothetical protein ACFVZ9_31850, partial [Streptomyces zaomyceticus]